MRQYKNFLILSLLLLTISGCNEIKSHKNFAEGTIEYSIQFENSNQTNLSSTMLPNHLTIKFRDDNISSRIEGLSGSVNLTCINNVKKQECIILVNLWGKKLYYQDSLTKGNLPNFYAGMPSITIEKTNDIVTFQGYNCKKAIAHSSGSSFEILYTNDIKIANPNANTPFDTIDGVMLKFNIILHKQLMSISATSIQSEDIPWNHFTIPPKYEKVPKKTIEDLISLMQ